jgi:tetratricopeptide (TPR) repeat protein
VSFWAYTLRLNPLCFPGQYNLANQYIRQGDPVRAAEHYRLAAVARDDLHQPWGKWAQTLMQIGDVEQAAEAYRGAIERVPFPSKGWTDYRLSLSRLLEQRGDLEEAERWLREAATKKGFLSRTHIRLAQFLQRQRRLDEAIASYEKALAARDLKAAQRPSIERQLDALRRQQAGGGS